MAERLLLLTGHLAEPRLRHVIAGFDPARIQAEPVNVGVKIAALMTMPIVLRRLPRPLAADRVIFPGRAPLDADALTREFGVPFERGPDELADLPRHLGAAGRIPDLSRHAIRIFAEIVDAPLCTPDGLRARARALRAEGADVIDLGCRPGTPFPGLEAAIRDLKAEGLTVSVDSGDPAELRRGALAGADILLSLTEHTLDVCDGTGATPVLIPAVPGDLESLLRAAATAHSRGISCVLDPILDPIHFGFTAALLRYAALRQRLPDADILMGTGNLTELTDADSAGITAMLVGICSELTIGNVLVVQVNPHTRRTVAEHDLARRLMFAARAEADLPRGYADGLLQVHDRTPFAQSTDDIAALAAATTDRNWRIATAPDGIHLYNNRAHRVAATAMDLYPTLDVATDGAHAFYLGTELARAEIALALGKRYVQDAPLDWGCAVPATPRETTRLATIGHTLRAKRNADDP